MNILSNYAFMLLGWTGFVLIFNGCMMFAFSSVKNNTLCKDFGGSEAIQRFAKKYIARQMIQCGFMTILAGVLVVIIVPTNQDIQISVAGALMLLCIYLSVKSSNSKTKKAVELQLKKHHK